MLVYLKQDLGCTSLNGQRIYGKKYAYGSFGPANIPAGVYEANREILEPAKYSQVWLQEKFKKPFPELSFGLEELGKFNLNVLIKIATGVGIKYVKGRVTTPVQKRALVRTIKKIISQA